MKPRKTTTGRTELVRRIAQNARCTQGVADEVLRALEAEVLRALDVDERVQLTGFGTFERRMVAARTARDPRTGERVQVPAGQRLVFKPSKSR